MVDRIAVLGRGMSLQVYRDYSHLFKKVYLVNGFDKDIKEAGLAHFKGKTITHVASRKGPTWLSKRVYKRFKITRVVTNAFKTNLITNRKNFFRTPQTIPKCMCERGYRPVGWKKIIKDDFTGKLVSDNKRCWPTTGLLAIDLALTENKPAELWLFGFDFYTTPYLSGQKITKKTPEKLEMMKLHLGRLVWEYENTQFHCASKFKVPAPNWHNVDRNPDLWATVPVKDLLAKQYQLGLFNRMDIFARLVAVENYFKKNDYGWKLYLRMQTIRMDENPSGARDRKREFIKLIKSVEKDGYKLEKPLRVRPSLRLINGSHRLAVALYFGVKEVLVWKDHTTKKKVHFNIKWFRKHGFKGKVCDKIEAKMKEYL